MARVPVPMEALQIGSLAHQAKALALTLEGAQGSVRWASQNHTYDPTQPVEDALSTIPCVHCVYLWKLPTLLKWFRQMIVVLLAELDCTTDRDART